MVEAVLWGVRMGSKGYRDTFRSTAWYYARYRPGYPEALFKLLRRKFALDGTGRLLDLGCGTGQLAVPLAADFDEVVAMDPEPEMLTEAAPLARARGATNVAWLEGGSADLEDLRKELGPFRLVTMGNSFHWMDRDATLRILYEMVLSGGGIAVVGSSGADSRWRPAETPSVVDAIVKRWLGPARRAGTATYEHPEERHEEVVRRSPFRRMELLTIPDYRRWTVDRLVGSLYSSSYASPFVLAEKREPFEADLRAALAALEPSGGFAEDVDVHAILAWES